MFFSHCSLSEFPSGSSLLRLYPKYLRILRVTFAILKILVCRKGSHWELDTLTFIWGLCLTQFNGCEKCRFHLQVTHGFKVFTSIPPWNKTYLRSTSFIERIRISHLSWVGMTFDPLGIPLTIRCDKSGA